MTEMVVVLCESRFVGRNSRENRTRFWTQDCGGLGENFEMNRKPHDSDLDRIGEGIKRRSLSRTESHGRQDGGI